MRPQTFKAPPLKESLIQTRIMQRLREHGWLVIRLNGGGFKDTTGRFVKTYIVQGLNACAGVPDVLAFKGGRFLLIEVKDARGKLTQSQERFHEYAERFGVEVNILRHWDEVDELVNHPV